MTQSGFTIQPIFATPVFFLGLALGFSFIASSASIAAAEKTRGDQMLQAYFQAETARLTEVSRQPGTDSLEAWQEKQKVLRAQLFEMLGLDPMPEKTDLKATVTGSLEREGIIVEKIHFQSRPGLYVTANLYRPATVEKPLPTILYLCGHGEEKKDGVSYGNKVHYQHHGVWFAKNGYVCLVLDTLQLGEIEGIHHGTYRYDRWWWNNRGYTPAGVEAWNCIRALDYLETRPEVDAKRIGATGRSGGGSYTWIISALDERIAASAPCAGITDMQNQVVDGVVRGHCDCMFFVNTYRWDFPTVPSLIAPRRLLLCNTDRDSIFPLDGVIRTYNQACDVYRLYQGKEKNVELVITPGPHDDTQSLRVPVFTFFNKHLKGSDELIEMAAKPLFTHEELKVFDKLPEDQINTKIDESFVAKAECTAPDLASQENADSIQKAEDAVIQTLRKKVFRGWPTQPCDLDIKKVDEKTKDGLAISTYEYTSQEHVRLPLYVVEPAGQHVVTEMDFRLVDEQQWNELEPELFGTATEKKISLKDGTRQVYVPTRGIGPTRWSGDKHEQTQIQRSFMLLGQTLDGMRVWDVCRAVQAVRQIFEISPENTSLRLTFSGNGTFGLIACYASLFEPKINTIGMSEPLMTAIQNHPPTLLNVDRLVPFKSVLAILERRGTLVYHSANDGPFYYGAATLPCRLFIPERYAIGNHDESYPLLIFLHGAGERGANNESQLVHGRPFMAKAAHDFNCFVLAPQCPGDKIWAGRHWEEKETSLTENPTEQMQLVMKTVEMLSKQYPIDLDRIYIMGLSMGGFGTWEAIQRWPERFAAAVPICGGGDATKVEQLKAENLPIWTFHGDKDQAVPVERTRAMVEALKNVDANVKYTECPGVGHNSWNNAFEEPTLLEWITSQRRTGK